MSGNLFTSQLLAKQLLGGDVPPMTPLTAMARLYVDPEFVPGMGALNDDVSLGLQCPLLGCGKFFKELGRHLRRHARLPNGEDAPTEERLCEVLGLGDFRLVSYAHRREQGRTPPPRKPARGRDVPQATVRDPKPRGPKRRKLVVSASSFGRRNVRMACDTQLKKRMQLVVDRVRREPGEREIFLVDPALLTVIRELGWSLEGFLGWFRLEIGTSGDKVNDVLLALDDFCNNNNGRPPNTKDFMLRDKCPPLPDLKLVQSVLCPDANWNQWCRFLPSPKRRGA